MRSITSASIVLLYMHTPHTFKRGIGAQLSSCKVRFNQAY